MRFEAGCFRQRQTPLHNAEVQPFSNRSRAGMFGSARHRAKWFSPGTHTPAMRRGSVSAEIYVRNGR